MPGNITLWQYSIHLASAEKILEFLLMWISVLLPWIISFSLLCFWTKVVMKEARTVPWGTKPSSEGWRDPGITSGDNAHDSVNGGTHFLPVLISSPHCHCDTPSSGHFSGSPGTKGITLALSGLNKTSLLPSYPLSFRCTSIFGL